MTTKPIRPSEVAAKQATLKEFPVFVIEAFNTLIAKNFTKATNAAVVDQDEVIDLILSLGMPFECGDRGWGECNRDTIFNEGWLDVEPLFESFGWTVVYYKSPYWEQGRSSFTFKARVHIPST